MFHSTGKKGLFTNENNFLINFNHTILSGYYYKFSDYSEPLELIKVPDLIEYGNFVIEHWNKPAKSWGYYDSLTDKYYLVNVAQIKQPFEQIKIGKRVTVEYNEAIKPTDSIIYPNSRIVVINGLLDIINDI